MSPWVSCFQASHSDCSLDLFAEQCHLELLALSNTKFTLCWQCPFHCLPNAKVPEKSGSGGHTAFWVPICKIQLRWRDNNNSWGVKMINADVSKTLT